MNHNVLIIGNHPLHADLQRQFCQRGDNVVHLAKDQGLTQADMHNIQEVVLLANYDKSPIEADNEVMGILEQLASMQGTENNNKQRLLCHLLLRNHSLLHIIRMEGFRKEIEDKLEVIPFTMEDQWGQIIAMGLDREPITKQSEKMIHLVIFGMSEMAEQVAINAAHVCHFPNYLKKDHSLRTRITVIDEKASEKSAEWTQRYQHLFDNCYYRHVNPQNRPAVINTSRPFYHHREDFVDIEWEFVSASPYNELVRRKISQWAKSTTQVLTILFANSHSEQALDEALHLPEEVTSERIPVFVYMQNDKAFKQIRQTSMVADIRPFGMVNYGYDINQPLMEMAKTVNYIYSQCRVMKTNDRTWKMEYAVEIDDEEREKLWTKLSFNKRISSYYNAMTIGVKMRSLGYKEDDWDKFYDISQEDIEMLAQVEHNRWNVEELILGWRPCNDEEQREVEADINMKEKLKKRKIHYDLRAYSDLRPDSSGKPVQIYDRCLSACIPLIAKESKGGGL